MNVAGKGIGLRLRQHAAAGETLLTVPAALWSPFSAEAAVQNARSQAAGFVERLEQLSGRGQRSRLTEVVCLALQLLFERGRGDAFAASLPVPDVPLLTWAPEELEELAGSRTHAAVLERRSFVRALHGSLFGAAESSPVSLGQLSWAMATITSRALSDSPSAPSMTLCPVLDLANHSDEPSCQHVFDQDTQSFNLKAARDLPREADVCISYGHLDNDRLLRQYGFTQPQNANDFSNIPPPWPPAPSGDDPLAALKRQLLRRPDVQSSDSDRAWWNSEVDAQPVSVTGGHDAAPLLVVLRLMHLAPTDVGGGRVVDAHTAVDATRPLSPGNEAAARASLSAAARSALDAFPSTMEQTQEALARHAAGDTTLATRKLHALRVRQGEQLALHGLLAACT